MSDVPSSLGPRPMPAGAADIRRRVHARLFGASGAGTETTAPGGGGETEPERGGTGTVPGEIGRFQVLCELGRGGMGLVYKAHDPELHRVVAIKVLREALAGAALDSTGAQRLLREAQALARLAHPHVVTVHEVGTWRGHVFVAMEWVEGVTLREWLRGRPPVDAIVRCFLQAAQGLAAAHRANLVHRDFKPDNVMVGRDGRVRVMDFGLARGPSELDPSVSGSGATSGSDDPLQTPLTRSGAIVGTPAYMAPEQHLGRPADAASDQFAFCVAFYEALVGERPFAGNSYPELAAEVVQGRRREPTGGGPRRLLAVLDRGLATSPRDRYPAMDDLHAALARSMNRPRWRIPAVAAVVLAASAAWWGAHLGSPCEEVGERLLGVWDAPRREALQRRGATDARPFAATTTASTERLLSRYAEEWRANATEVCAARAFGAVDEPAALARETCLEGRLAELQALVDVLLGGDEAVLLESVEAAAALSDISSCRQVQPSAPETSPEDLDLRAQLISAKIERSLGRYEAALAAVTSVLSTVEATNDPVSIAEALIVRGDVEESLGTLDGAEVSLRRAAELAATAGRHDLRAAALVRLVYVLGLRSEYALARMAAAEARAVLDVLGAAPVLRAQLDANLGVVARRAGELDVAVGHHRRAAAVFAREQGDEHPATAKAQANLGTVLSQRGHHDEAQEALRAALAAFERVLGREHPHVATVLGALATDASRTGQMDEAAEWMRRSLEIRKNVLSPGHPAIARALYNLARIDHRRGAYLQAAAWLKEGRDALGERPGEPPRTLAEWDALEGANAFHLGHWDDAERLLDRATAQDPSVEDFELAIHRWTLAARRDPEIGLERAELGVANRRLGARELQLYHAWRTVFESVDALAHLKPARSSSQTASLGRL